jgi:Family of unknown function (DUF6516)
MKTKLVRNRKVILPDGAIVEYVVWELPEPVPGSSHRFKYRLYFGHNGLRIVGFDNERGKGDHSHLDGSELPYVFTTVDQLLDDFFDEIERRMQP